MSEAGRIRRPEGASEAERAPPAEKAPLAWIAPAIVALLSIGFVGYALWALTYATFGRDQGIFQYVAWAVRNGERAYRDFHEINGPLPHVWHMLLQKLGGEDEHVFRSIDTAVLVVGYGACASTLPRWVGLPLPRRPMAVAWALAGVAVFGAQYVRYDWWNTTQRESLYAVLVLGACSLQATAHSTKEARVARVALGVAGFLMGLTWFGKPPCALFTVLQVAVLVFDRASLPIRLRGAIALVAGGLAAATAAMILFVVVYEDPVGAVRMLSKVPRLHHDIQNLSIGDAYRAFNNRPRLDWAAVTVAIFLAAFRVLRMPRRAWLALVLPVGGFAIFTGQGKGFPYHLHMVTLGTAVMQLLVLAALVRHAGERALAVRAARAADGEGDRLAGALSVLAVLLSVGLGVESMNGARLSMYTGSDWPTAGATKDKRASRAYLERFAWGNFFAADLRDGARYVSRVTDPGERIQTYGLDPYFLFLAKRMSATPVIYDFELNVDAALAGGSGSRPTEATKAWLRAYRDDAERLVLERVRREPPAAFVFFDQAPFTTPEDGERDFAKHCPSVYDWMRERYAPAVRFGTIRIRLRMDVAVRSAGRPEP